MLWKFDFLAQKVGTFSHTSDMSDTCPTCCFGLLLQWTHQHLISNEDVELTFWLCFLLGNGNKLIYGFPVGDLTLSCMGPAEAIQLTTVIECNQKLGQIHFDNLFSPSSLFGKLSSGKHLCHWWVIIDKLKQCYGLFE